MAVMLVVQMTVVQVVGVIVVFDGGVAAAFAVNVVVMFVCFAAHGVSFSESGWLMLAMIACKTAAVKKNFNIRY